MLQFGKIHSFTNLKKKKKKKKLEEISLPGCVDRITIRFAQLFKFRRAPNLKIWNTDERAKDGRQAGRQQAFIRV